MAVGEVTSDPIYMFNRVYVTFTVTLCTKYSGEVGRCDDRRTMMLHWQSNLLGGKHKSHRDWLTTEWGGRILILTTALFSSPALDKFNDRAEVWLRSDNKLCVILSSFTTFVSGFTLELMEIYYLVSTVTEVSNTSTLLLSLSHSAWRAQCVAETIVSFRVASSERRQMDAYRSQ